jgi:hypothetical protein
MRMAYVVGAVFMRALGAGEEMWGCEMTAGPLRSWVSRSVPAVIGIALSM